MPSSSRNSNFSPNSPPSWLVEIHSKLWERRELFGQIFRTATLTKCNFIELQRQLQELNPERASESYVAKDVLATKLAFLRFRSTALDTNIGGRLAPRLVFDASQSPLSDIVDNDDDEAAADDVMVIDSDNCSSTHVNLHMTHLSNEATPVFPCTVRYLDLTVLKLETHPRLPQLMLYRNEL